MPSSSWRLTLALVLCLGLAACVSTQSTAFPVGIRRTPKPADARVSLFRGTAPTDSFEQVARLNVHIEKTFFVPTAFEEARPQLEELARSHGADALMNIEEKTSRLNETFIYNVTATAIVFTNSAR